MYVYGAVMASILKNLTEHEEMTVNLSYSLANMEKLRGIAQFQPRGVEVSQDITGHFDAIHVDYEEDGTPTLYDVVAESLTEMRGEAEFTRLSPRDFHFLLTSAMRDVDPASVLGILHEDYLEVRKEVNPWRNFDHYLKGIFSVDTREVKEKFKKRLKQIPFPADATRKEKHELKEVRRSDVKDLSDHYLLNRKHGGILLP